MSFRARMGTCPRTKRKSLSPIDGLGRPSSALTENWGYRKVKRYVDKAISALDAPGPKKVRGRPRVPFKWDERRLQVDVRQLDTLSASQKQELRTVIEGILQKR